MSIVYLEDITKFVGNKYLAINIAAQRARQLNEKGIPILSMSAKKPASVALEELVEGKIGYKELDPNADVSEDLLIFHSDDDVDGAEDVADLQPDQVYVDDSNISDPDEPEEGL
jgi:DNA-directed RNA polymerase subunit omega